MENGQIVSSGNQEQLKDDIHFNMLLTGNNKEWFYHMYLEFKDKIMRKSINQITG